MAWILWGTRNLARHPGRTGLTLLGIAVASAMLLDMVMLGGGLEHSFERLLLSRGFQVRVSPRGTLPFDTEARIGDAGALVAGIRADPDVDAVAPVLGGSLYARVGDRRVTLFGYGVDPAVEALYRLDRGENLAPGETDGILLSEPAATLLGATLGDTVELAGWLDPQVAERGRARRLVVRGGVGWLYDYRGQPSVGLPLGVMQDLVRPPASDMVSAVLVRLHADAPVEPVVARLRARHPAVSINSVADLVSGFRARLVYFRQVAFILGTISLVVTVLLVGTLLTITVHERLAEIATLRAIGVRRSAIVLQVLGEGLALTLAGGALGTALGLATARYLDAILTSFPGLPAAISFFVPRAGPIATAALLLLLAGSVAGVVPALSAASAPIAATLREEAV